MQLVIIEWRDIIQTSGWETEEEVKCPTIRSVGWLIPQDNTLAPEDFDESKEDKEHGITAFPKGCIVKIELLSYEVSNVLG